LNDAAVPAFPTNDQDDEEETVASGRIDLDYELPASEWRPIPPGEPFGPVPQRFIDGSIQSRTVASLLVDYRQRPVIAAVASAASLRLEGRRLTREPGGRILKALAVNSNGISAEELEEARSILSEQDVELIVSEAEEPSNFDAMRRSARQRAMTAMEDLERDVMLAQPDVPTLMDGLLERRLARQREDVPVFGLVKRQISSYLPSGLQEMVYRLKTGERSPIFVLDTVQHVSIANTYLRLSSPPGASPTYGIVRVTAPLAYLHSNPELATADARGAFFSGLVAFLSSIRQRDFAYARAGISVEPIVRLEDHLHAIQPDIEVLVQKIHRLLPRTRLD
jgi:hypothetical protein